MTKCDSGTIIEQQIKTIRSINKRADILCVLSHDNEKVYKQLEHLKLRYIFNTQHDNSYNHILYALRNTHGSTWIIHGGVQLDKKIIKTYKESTTFMHEKKTDDVGLGLHKDIVTNFSYGHQNTWQRLIFFNVATANMLRKEPLTPNNKKFDFELYNHVVDKHTVRVIKHQLNIHTHYTGLT